MEGIRFAIDYYGADHVMYGSDYPCWSPADALRFLDETGISAVDQQKILYSNARRILGLRDPKPTDNRQDALDPAAA